MKDHTNTLGSVAVISLCLAGLSSSLLIWMAGSPRFGVLSTIWQDIGIGSLVACGLGSLLIAALVLRRMYQVSRARPHGLLAFLVVSAIPCAFFVAVLAARFFHGE